MLAVEPANYVCVCGQQSYGVPRSEVLLKLTSLQLIGIIGNKNRV